jgi:pyruvate formate lyase activating enzyme
VQKGGFTEEDCLGEARVKYGKEVTVSELLPLLLEDKDFYENSRGGVTLSGGECLMQADFCRELLRALKENGINTATDTSGYAAREALDKVIPYTDTFLYDIKAIDEDVHIKCTGRSNKLIIDNLKYLDSLGKRIEIRIPYVPGYNDGEMEGIAELLATMKSIVKIRVLPYHNYSGSKYTALGKENTSPSRLPTDTEISHAKEALKRITGIPVVD